jgi:Glycogen recognition site of AMP-activated protein kinase
MGLSTSRAHFATGAAEVYATYTRSSPPDEPAASTAVPPHASAKRRREDDGNSCDGKMNGVPRFELLGHVLGPGLGAERTRGAGGNGHMAGLDGDLDGDEDPSAELVPVVLTWSFGASAVHVTGEWSGWKGRTEMIRDGNNGFVVVLYLKAGRTYECKFIQDGNWSCNPNLPTKTDSHGNTNNVIDVDTVHAALVYGGGDDDAEAVGSSTLPVDVSGAQNPITARLAAAFSTGPPSPPSSYDQSFVDPATHGVDPPPQPDHCVRDGPARHKNPLTFPASSRSLIDHLYIDPAPAWPSAQPAYLYTAASPESSAYPPPQTLASAFSYKGKIIAATFILATQSSLHPLHPQTQQHQQHQQHSHPPSHEAQSQQSQYDVEVMPQFSI